jgi:putative copper export protein
MITASTAAAQSGLADTSTIIRLSLHVLAATIWVGGMIVIGAVVPVLRAAGNSDLPALVARRFNLIAWPAFAVLVLTGIWNVAVAGSTTQSWQAVLGVKLALVVVSGLFAFLHTRATNPALRGASAGIALLAALGAMVAGVALAG